MTRKAASKSTARKGNPRQASRGAAVARAKAALGDAIDRRLQIDLEAMEFAMLAGVIGVPADEVPGRLNSATLDELELWTRAILAPAKAAEVAA